VKNLGKYNVFIAALVTGAAFFVFGRVDYSQEAHKSTKASDVVAGIEANKDVPEGYQRVTVKIESVDDLNHQLEEYMRSQFPIISDFEIEAIKGSIEVTKNLVNDTLGHVDFYLNFNVPKHYLDPQPVMLWELNIPEFASRLYQIYDGDTILIDAWPNVVGKPSTKTYTGYYNIFRLRNWPSWKDPESDPLEPATPPGPGNPLGLFAAHYDESSLRYFHGTNKSYLLKNEYRALSHGCVRNLNDNIDKMKRFIVTKMVTSQDLSFWITSKRSMMYDFTDEEKQRFPVRIIYKTFDLGSDSRGDYINFFADIYRYADGSGWSKFDREELMTFTTTENILAEYKAEHKPNQFQLSDDKLIPIIEKLISDHKDYQKYYFDDLVRTTTETGN
jgi:hypothetical protein